MDFSPTTALLGSAAVLVFFIQNLLVSKMDDTAGSNQFHYARLPIIVLCNPIPLQELELEHRAK